MDYQIAPYRVGDMMGEAWRLVQENFTIIVGIHSIGIILAAIINYFEPSELWTTLLSFALAPISLGVTIKVLLDCLREEIPSMEACFNFAGPRYLKALATGLIYIVAVFVGLCLLIVPGIYIAIKFWLATTVSILEPISIKESFGRAGDMMEGNYWRIIGLNILVGILFLVALLVIPFVGHVLQAWMGQSDIVLFLTTVFTTLVSIIPNAFTSALVVIAYFGLRAKNEDIGDSILDELPR